MLRLLTTRIVQTLVLGLTLISCTQTKVDGQQNLAANNILTEKEKSEGWELLFDGTTTNGWRNYNKETIGSAWKVINGELTLTQEGGKVVDGGDIITNKSYNNFELRLEWKIQPNGNSGIIYNVIESDDWNFAWQTGPEMQILDNEGHPDGRFEKHRAGDLYDLIESKPVTVKSPEEWNQVRLIKKDGKVEYWQNGHKIVEFEMWTEEWDELVKNSKFKDMPGFGKAKSGGHIALQDHRDPVSFRNIKIKVLD